MAALGARIASGGSSELFEFGPGRVLKLFRRESGDMDGLAP